MIFKIDTDNAQRQLLNGFSELSQKKVNLSITRAINSALDKTKTAAARAVTARYNLTYADVTSRLFVVKASPATAESMQRGYLKSYGQPFPLSYFGAQSIQDGTVTAIKGRGKKMTTSQRKAAFLRTEKDKIRNGVVVQVMRGNKSVLRSAFFRDNRVIAKGKYDRGFQFMDDAKSTTLRGISVAAVLRSNNINPILKQYAENEYLRILYRELQKRVKGVGEQHSKYV